jgi:hypothetical protein
MIELRKIKEKIDWKFISLSEFRGMTIDLIHLAKKNVRTIKEKFERHSGTEGNNRHITGEMYTNLPTEYCLKLSGVMGEDRKWHKHSSGMWLFGNYTIEKWYEFLKSIAEDGLKWPIFITVDYKDRPKINEGNHRVQAFEQLKIETIPANIRFFGKAEEHQYAEYIDNPIYDKIRQYY